MPSTTTPSRRIRIPVFSGLFNRTVLRRRRSPRRSSGLGRAVRFDRIAWTAARQDDPAVREVWCDGASRPLLGAAARPGVRLAAELRQSAGPAVGVGQRVRLSVRAEDKPAEQLIVEGRVGRAGGPLLRVDLDLDPAALLARLGGRPAFTRLECCVLEDRAASGALLASSNLLLPLVQHSLFFLPGVLGSRISVSSHEGRVVECFPTLSLLGDLELDLLACDPQGKPYREALRAKLTLLDHIFVPLGPLKVYAVRALVQAEERRAFPAVYLDAGRTRRMRHILYNDVPYDWRLDIASSHREIAARIRALYDFQKGAVEHHPFLADQVALAGHSTGGVVMRGLMTTDNALRGLVGPCFFLNVPQLGAPKAEYVFLTGDMGVPLFTNKDAFRQIAPDMPIVYYLSPGRAYGERSGQDWSPAGRERRVRHACGLLSYDTAKRALFGRPGYKDEPGLRFNRGLAEAADRYCDETGRAAKSLDVPCYVFHSGGLPTIVATRVDLEARKVVPQYAPVGDGTVPTLSQLGDLGEFPNATLFKPIPGNPAHTKAPNSPWVWKQVARVLAGDDAYRAETMPFPITAAGLQRAALDNAREAGARGSEREGCLTGGAVERIGGSGKSGAALIECLAGELELRGTVHGASGSEPMALGRDPRGLSDEIWKGAPAAATIALHDVVAPTAARLPAGACQLVHASALDGESARFELELSSVGPEARYRVLFISR